MPTTTIIIDKTKPNIPWEGCFNSVIYRIERGVPVEVPDYIAEIIRNSEAERKRAERLVHAYASATGAKLS